MHTFASVKQESVCTAFSNQWIAWCKSFQFILIVG